MTWLPGKPAVWIETETQSMADYLPAIVTHVREIPRLLEATRREQEEQLRRRAQEDAERRERIRQKEEDRRERQRLIELENSRRARLRQLACEWDEATRLRAFLIALRELADGHEEDVVEGRMLREWLAWADERAAKLDPFADGFEGVIRALTRSG